MNECLQLLKDSYNLVNNSINLEPIIGLNMGLFDFFIGVVVLFTICAIVINIVFGKVVEYINTPTEEEKFYEDVNNEMYRRVVKAYARKRKLKHDDYNMKGELK